MQALPFDKPGRFFRGNLHTHSTCSDGGLAPEAVIDAYRSRGYDFMSLTDHFLPNAHFRPGTEGFIPVTDTAGFRDDGFTTIHGAELHGPEMENGELWHLVAVGLPLDFALSPPAESGAQVARRAMDAGAFVTIAHPSWNSLSIDDALTLIDVVHGIEVYNTSCDVSVDRGETWHFAEQLLQRGHRLTAVAADDAHFKDPAHPDPGAFGGWVQVRATSLDPDELLAALKAGWFYSSTGPEIHDVRIRDGEITVACSPVQRVIVTGVGSRSQRRQGSPGQQIETCALPLERFEEHGVCRVTVVDAAGKRAWTNPIWLDGTPSG